MVVVLADAAAGGRRRCGDGHQQRQSCERRFAHVHSSSNSNPNRKNKKPTGKSKTRARNIITSLDLDPYAQEIFNKKLSAKYKVIREKEVRFEEFECDDAEYLFVAYGTSARVCMKSVEIARNQGIKVGLLRPITLYPFPSKRINELASQMKHIVSVEMSAGQMTRLVARLKRIHYCFVRLHEILTARITAEPIYELKMGFSLHSHYCAEHTTALRQRIGEMREPPLGLEEVPHPALEIFLDEILSAPTTEQLVVGIYDKALPAIKHAFEKHLTDTNPLADHPSVRLIRFTLLEVDEMLNYGAQVIRSLISADWREKNSAWLKLLDDCFATAGGLDGTGAPTADPASCNVAWMA
jgi:hypothetical protein